MLLRDQADFGRFAATFSSFVWCLFDFVNSRKRAKKEVKVLSTLSRLAALFSHTPGEAPNIIRYFTSWQEDDFFFIQLEYCFYGSISKYLEHVSPFPPFHGM